jgi:rubredoxin
MPVEILRIPGGLRVDGLDLRGGKCGCTSIAKCCYSWSKVKKKGENLIEFTAKMTTPDTSEEFSWGYAVRKDGMTVSVSVDDAKDKTIYSGFFPPALQQWEARGWEVMEKRAAGRDAALWRCSTCKWLYKEDDEGIPFEKLTGDWRCPECNAPRGAFEKIC